MGCHWARATLAMLPDCWDTHQKLVEWPGSWRPDAKRVTARHCPLRGPTSGWVKQTLPSIGWRPLSLNATRSWDLQWYSPVTTLYASKQDSGDWHTISTFRPSRDARLRTICADILGQRLLPHCRQTGSNPDRDTRSVPRSRLVVRKSNTNEMRVYRYQFDGRTDNFLLARHLCSSLQGIIPVNHG